MQREPAKSYEDLVVWQKAHRLVLDVYELTKSFPVEEKYHLVVQVRDAAASVAAMIAEGFRRRSKPDKLHFVTMAHGSLNEAHYFLRLSHDLRYAPTDDLRVRAEEVSKLLDAYGRAILRDMAEDRRRPGF